MQKNTLFNFSASTGKQLPSRIDIQGKKQFIEFTRSLKQPNESTTTTPLIANQP
jgi:hypothetical protein